VEVLEGDAHARLPAERRRLELPGQGAQRHVLVEEQALLAVGAVSHQIDEVGVVEQAEHQHLHQELVVALNAVPVQLLHGHRLLPAAAALQPAPVHAPEPALAQQALRTEVARRGGELPVRERARTAVAGCGVDDDVAACCRGGSLLLHQLVVQLVADDDGCGAPTTSCLLTIDRDSSSTAMVEEVVVPPHPIP
jgi:hypothetical protein